MTCLSGPVSRLTAGRVGHRRRSGPATSGGLCPWCCRGGGSLCRSPGRRAAWPPVPGGQGASRWLLPGGRRGRSAAVLARVRGGRIKVIVAWRRARRPGRLCRRHQPPREDAGQVPRCPGLAPSRIRRWCAHRVPVDARGTGSGRDAIHGPAPDDRPAPHSRATGPPAWYRRSRHLRFHRHGQDLTGLRRASPELSAWPGGTGAGGLPVPPAGGR